MEMSSLLNTKSSLLGGNGPLNGPAVSLSSSNSSSSSSPSSACPPSGSASPGGSGRTYKKSYAVPSTALQRAFERSGVPRLVSRITALFRPSAPSHSSVYTSFEKREIHKKRELYNPHEDGFGQADGAGLVQEGGQGVGGYVAASAEEDDSNSLGEFDFGDRFISEYPTKNAKELNNSSNF